MLKNQDKLFIGAHQSIAGGIFKALKRAAEINTNTLQIFTKNSNRWKGKEISEKDIEKFFKLKEELKIEKIIAHAPYLVNLASPDAETTEKSRISLIEDISNCLKLNIRFLVLHPGSHKGAGVEKGIENVAKNLDKVLNFFESENITILLETTAGQGNSVGHKFDHLAAIRQKMLYAEKIGFCLDTCHMFAAGYDFRSVETYNFLKKQLSETLVLENIFAIHVNDSKKELGSRIDRHEHIGKGFIGEDGFKFFLNDNDFRKIPFILETPKENNMDKKNLQVLKKLTAT